MADREEPWSEPSVVEWAHHVLDDMVPMVRDSAIVASLLPSADEDGTVGDVKYWVEMGASICMNKPILIVVMGDAVVPDKIRAVADEIVRLPEGVTPASSDQLGAAIKAFAEKHGGGGG